VVLAAAGFVAVVLLAVAGLVAVDFRAGVAVDLRAVAAAEDFRAVGVAVVDFRTVGVAAVDFRAAGVAVDFRAVAVAVDFRVAGVVAVDFRAVADFRAAVDLATVFVAVAPAVARRAAAGFATLAVADDLVTVTRLPVDEAAAVRVPVVAVFLGAVRAVDLPVGVNVAIGVPMLLSLPAVSVLPAARLAAGLVVTLLAAAIVSSPLCRRLPLVGWRDAMFRARLRPLSLPAGVLRIPGLIAVSYPIERVLRFVGRVVRSEPVHRGADVVLGLHAVMRKAPVVPVSTAAAHDITVHRESHMRHRFA
jgi:hypothetical protein